MFRLHSLITTATMPSRKIRRRILASSLWSQNVATAEEEEETVTIKPSSPTPSHLTKFRLSLIDNLIPPCYVPFIFFYNNNNPAAATGPTAAAAPAASERSEVLKSSLAQALTRFYPLAGRLSNSDDDDDGKDSTTPVVHCNDEGVPFSFATVADDGKSSLESFLMSRGGPEIADSLQRFLPFPAVIISTPAGVESAPQVAIKATVFPCGGVAIGVCFLHKIVDTHTVVDFMKLWAAIVAVGGKNEQAATVLGGGAYAHDRGATWLFPARAGDVIPSTEDFVSPQGEGRKKKEKNVTKRFVFDEEAISALKLRARSERVPNPTRSEAIGGLLWKCAVKAVAMASSADGVNPAPVCSVAAMAVDLRYRMKESLADYSVGNLVWGPISLYETNHKKLHSSDVETKVLQEMVHKLRSAIQRVDVEFMERLEGGAGREEHMRNEEMKQKMMATGAQSGSKVMQYFMVTSIIRSGLYDVDFGWGKPVWTSMAKFADEASNLVVLMDSPTGYGVEVWIALEEQEMSLLERDPEFLTYTKVE